MKLKSVKELLGLINDGFEGEVRFSGAVSLHGDGMLRVSYSGDLALKNEKKISGPNRYEISSNDLIFRLPFAQSKTAHLEHSRIVIPIFLPAGYYVCMHNPRNIMY